MSAVLPNESRQSQNAGTQPGATLELPFRAPYDWPRMLRFLAGRATPGVEAVEDGAWLRAIDFNGASGTLAVRH